MADVTANAQPMFADGLCEKFVLYAVKNCTTADTFNVGAQLSVIKLAGLVSATGSTIAQLSFTGTVVTIPTGVNKDAVWCMISGVAA